MYCKTYSIVHLTVRGKQNIDCFYVCLYTWATLFNKIKSIHKEQQKSDITCSLVLHMDTEQELNEIQMFNSF